VQAITITTFDNIPVPNHPVSQYQKMSQEQAEVYDPDPRTMRVANDNTVGDRPERGTVALESAGENFRCVGLRRPTGAPSTREMLS